MRRSRSRATTPRWPFWLLLAAWICANSPQAATYALLSWLAEARSFTHQHRLTAEVASLLGGERGVNREAAIAKAAEPAPAKLPPAVPAEAVLKKISLSLERLAEMAPPEAREHPARAAGQTWRGAFRAPPPHGPPRSAAG